EDLQPFNEELTARAIAASSIPIISAVGHETDYTIADFAADLRAPTPSAAAELAVPVKETLYNRIEQLTASLEQSAANRLENADRRLASLSDRSVFVRPVSIVERHEAKLALLNQRFLNVNFNRTSRSETRTSKLIERHLVAGRQLMLKRIARYEMLSKALIALSPLAVLTRGYAAVRRPSGEMVSSAAVLSKDDVVDIVFSDGEAGAKIIRPFGG
ncbi:MAG TPA: exodeoxyribonuclease VII large subunit, partial [Bacillota bacterium]|nr:exodeoxyribonuclease VII large subunit [Bacillota bacterium]